MSAADIAARSTAPEAGKAVVKPLEWRAGSRKCQRAQAALGFYEIEPQGPDRFGLFINYHAVKATFASWDEAKAAAQRDFEQCILSALASVPAPSGAGELCEDCPPVGYPTDTTRCLPCPRRATPQAVPAEDVAGLVAYLSNPPMGGNNHAAGPYGREQMKIAAAALTSLSAERDEARAAWKQAIEMYENGSRPR